MLLHKERLDAAISQHNLAAIIATTPENVLYTSGFWCLPQWIRRGPQAFVVLGANKNETAPVIVTGTSTLDLLADQGVPAKVRRYGSFTVDTHPSARLDAVSSRQAELQNLPDDGNAINGLISELRTAGLVNRRIGIDEVGLMPGDIDRLRDALPDVTWVMATSTFRTVRAVKTTEEIERLRIVAQITERSVQAALSVAREGATESDLARAFHTQTVQEDGFPVLGCIAFGERSALMNVQPSTRPLRRGDIIRFDVGGHYRNYRADIAKFQ